MSIKILHLFENRLEARLSHCWKKSTKGLSLDHSPLGGDLGGVASGLVELARSVWGHILPFSVSGIQTNMEPGSSVGAVRSSRVLLGQELRPAVLVIKDGKIHQIQPHSTDVACEVTNKAKLMHQKSEWDQAFQTLIVIVVHA